MECLIVTGGKSPPIYLLHSLNDRCKYVISADSGLDACVRAGIDPDYVLGDFDSVLSTEFLKRFEDKKVDSFSKEKDYTDTELAMSKAFEQGYKKVIIAGGGGGRLDHLLGVYSIFLRENPPCEWHTHNESCILIEKEYKGKFPVGKRLSFFPVSESIATMESIGLKWPLDTCRWKPGDAGISNRVSNRNVRISMKTGKLLMIYDHSSKDRE